MSNSIIEKKPTSIDMNKIKKEIDELIGKPWKKEDTYNENQYSFYESEKEAVLAIIEREQKLAFEQGSIYSKVGIKLAAKNNCYTEYITDDGDKMYNLAAVCKERKSAKEEMIDVIFDKITDCCCDDCLNIVKSYLDKLLNDLEKGTVDKQLHNKNTELHNDSGENSEKVTSFISTVDIDKILINYGFDMHYAQLANDNKLIQQSYFKEARQSILSLIREVAEECIGQLECHNPDIRERYNNTLKLEQRTKLNKLLKESI